MKAKVRESELGNPACAGESYLPDWAMDREFYCWQPDELDNKEFNMVIVDDSDNVFLVKSIDFDFI